MNETIRPQPETSKALGAPMPSKHSFKPLRECKHVSEALETHELRERVFASAPSHIGPERMLHTIINAANKNPDLKRVPLPTFVGAVMTLAQIGLEPNTPLGEAYLIPIKRSVFNKATRKWEDAGFDLNVIFGYQGLLALAYRSPLVHSVTSGLVWPGDGFVYKKGDHGEFSHEPRMSRPTPGEQPIAAYAYAELERTGLAEVVPYYKVLEIRDNADAYKAAAAARDKAMQGGYAVPNTYLKAPWVAHEHAMARKTAIRAIAKLLPRSPELAAAVAIDESQDRRRRAIDFGRVMDAPMIDGTQDYLDAAVEAARAPDEDEPEQTEATKPTERAARTTTKATETATPAAQPSTAPTKSATQAAQTSTAAATAFEALIVDCTGDLLRDEPYTDPVACADAILTDYRALTPDEAAAFLEFNADLIEDLRQTHGAALGTLDSPPVAAEVAKPSADVIVGVSVPPGRGGKPDWAGYLRAMKEAVAATSSPMLGAWLEMQRETLAACPLAQRAHAIKAISARLAATGRAAPDWFAGIVAPVESTPADRAGPAPAAQAAPEDDRDQKWADAQIREVNAISMISPPDAALNRFVELAESPAIKTVMSRLRREKPPVFERVASAYRKVQEDIESRMPGGKGDAPGEDGPPEDDAPPGDPTEGGF